MGCDACNRYNTTKVQEVGYHAASAIWDSGTFTSSPQPPYQLVMQLVRTLDISTSPRLAGDGDTACLLHGGAICGGHGCCSEPALGVTKHLLISKHVLHHSSWGSPARALHMRSGLSVWAQDCNLVAYSGLAPTFGYNAATAVYYSRTFSDAASAPCSLVVSSTDGGSIFVAASSVAILYQQPQPMFSGLYAFQNITFSTCGLPWGRLGPQLSDCTSAYAQYGAWTNNTAFLNVEGGIQVWTVPATGTYT